MVRALNVYHKLLSAIPLYFYMITIISALSYFYVFVISGAWYAWYRCIAVGDVIGAIIMFSLCVSSEIGNAKFIFVYMNRGLLRNIVEDCLDFDAAIPLGSRMSNNILQTLKAVKLRAILFWIALMGNGTLYVSKPLLTPGRQFMDGVYTILELQPLIVRYHGAIMVKIDSRIGAVSLLVLPSLFEVGGTVNICYYCLTRPEKAIVNNTMNRPPHSYHYLFIGLEPMSKSPNYEFGYLLVAISVWFLCYVPANVTGVLIMVSGYIEAQMFALSHELLHIWEDAKHDYQRINFSVLQRGTTVDSIYETRLMNEFVNTKLRDIIRRHVKNVELLQMLENAIRGAIAMEFLLLVLGLIAELLGGLEKTFLEVPYAIVQVAMDCFTGQRVIDASTAFENAVYACKWENFNKHNMKIVLLMLGNSQKAMKLSAGGMTTLSFVSLMSVVRSIYSTYTALRSTLK